MIIFLPETITWHLFLRPDSLQWGGLNLWQCQKGIYQREYWRINEMVPVLRLFWWSSDCLINCETLPWNEIWVVPDHIHSFLLFNFYCKYPENSLVHVLFCCCLFLTSKPHLTRFLLLSGKQKCAEQQPEHKLLALNASEIALCNLIKCGNGMWESLILN